VRLTPEEGRVVGSLVEKQLTTPQAYPLTDSALIAACNQATSRDPVVSYDLTTVRTAVRSLREQGLVRTVHRPGERSDKHQHELPAALDLDPAAVAVLAVLLLRGPQTAAELRARTERMHPFDAVGEVEDVLATLAERGLAERLPRLPGRREDRWAELLVEGTEVPPPSAPVDGPAPDLAAEVAALREEVAALRDEVAALRGVSRPAGPAGASAG
jgi:uncharacterized protein